MAFNRVSKLMARSERATPVGEGSADLLQTCALRFFFFGRQTGVACFRRGGIHLFLL